MYDKFAGKVKTNFKTFRKSRMEHPNLEENVGEQ